MAAISPLVSALDGVLERARDTKADPSLLSELERARAMAVSHADALQQSLHEVARLTNRYVAQLRLFDALELEKICDAITDVVVNLLGSEDFVVYLGDRDGDLYPVRGMGPSDETAGGLGAEDPLTVLVHHKHLVFDHDGWVALAPMLDAGEVPVGLIAIRSLLRHKPALTDDDKVVLDELRANAGRAMGLMLARSPA